MSVDRSAYLDLRPVDRLPLACRIRRHGHWKPSLVMPGSWWRNACHRCDRLNIPVPKGRPA